MINPQRMAVASLVVSAATIIGIASNEGYSDKSYKDAGGVTTIGFGETKDVKLGQKTDPVRALIQLEKSAKEHAKGMAECIHVPISQREYDAFLDFTYNVGVSNFCNSTLNKKLNSGDYEGACKELLNWNRAGGQVLNGLTKRRQAEYQQCIGN